MACYKRLLRHVIGIVALTLLPVCVVFTPTGPVLAQSPESFEQEQARLKGNSFIILLHNPWTPEEMPWALKRDNELRALSDNDRKSVKQFVGKAIPSIYAILRDKKSPNAVSASSEVRTHLQEYKNSSWTRDVEKYAMIEDIIDLRKSGAGYVYGKAIGYVVNRHTTGGHDYGEGMWEFLLSHSGGMNYTLEKLQLRSLPRHMIDTQDNEFITWEFEPEFRKTERDAEKVKRAARIRESEAIRELNRSDIKLSPFDTLHPKVRPTPWADRQYHRPAGTKATTQLKTFVKDALPYMYRAANTGNNDRPDNPVSPVLLGQARYHVVAMLKNDNADWVDAEIVEFEKIAKLDLPLSYVHSETDIYYLVIAGGAISRRWGENSMTGGLRWEILVKKPLTGNYQIVKIQQRQAKTLEDARRYMRRASTSDAEKPAQAN